MVRHLQKPVYQAKKNFEPGKFGQRAGNFGFMPRQALANVLNQPR
jgi:hypothetical protein